MKRTLLYLIPLSTLMLLIIILLHKPLLLEGIDFSTAIYDNQHHLLRLTLSKDSKYRLFTPLANISPNVVQATLLQEDYYFYSHMGVNLPALWRAGWQTYVIRKHRLGGSTLSMQVARLRYGIHSHTFFGKCWQIMRALQLEHYYSKNQILEAYLNLAGYGNNIEGVAAASLIYYHQPVKQLNLAQALTLAVIPQNPNQRSPNQPNVQELKFPAASREEFYLFDFAPREPSSHGRSKGRIAFSPWRTPSPQSSRGKPRELYLKSARDKLFARWLEKNPHTITQSALIRLPLQIYRIQDLPFLAPHFVDNLLQQASPDHEIVTSLDLNLQNILETAIKKYITHKNAVGIHNAAAILIDTRTMQVKAMVGSADFFDRNISGQVNGTAAKRSPGSTLKPFIYALAMDQGIIHPNTVLKDAPTRFGDYNPENFDGQFLGPIKAKDALIQSRNIPALFLASQLKHPDFYQFLQQAQVSHMKAADSYGLSLVLGGAEINMQELVTLYAMLVNSGNYHQLHMRADQTLDTGQFLLSPEASFLVLNILKDNPRPDQIQLNALKNTALPIAWKTGTSSGFRDAWSVGVFGPYALAVWIGNFDGSGNPTFIGQEAAAPLFFNIIDAITHQAGPLPDFEKDPKQLHLTQIPVCETSGMLPTQFCPHTVPTWFIIGKSPIKKDTIYREIMINPKTGLRACHIAPENKFAVYEFWPSDLLQIFREAGIARRSPPPYEADCNIPAQAQVGSAPHITSPLNILHYSIKTSGDTIIPLSATVDSDVKTLYWFLGNRYLGKTSPLNPWLWVAQPGKFIVRAVDDYGRSDAVNLQVEVVN